MLATAPAASGPRFGDVAGCIEDAVRRVAQTRPDPLDPFRGLYLSDEDALRLAGQDAASPAAAGARDEALDAVAGRLGLDPLDAVLLALCAAPELDARFGRLIGYLHDDLTRRLVTPRLAARLVGGVEAETAVLARFGAGAPLRASGAVRVVETEVAVPLADAPVRVDERLAAHLLGADLAPPAHGNERLVGVPGADPGRDEAVGALQRILSDRPAMPVVVCGVDAAELLAWAGRRPVLLLDARDAAEPDTLGSARIAALLAGAQLALDLPAAGAPEDADRARRGLELAGEGALACARSPRDAPAPLAPLVIETPPPSFAERLALWQEEVGDGAAGVEAVAAAFRLSTGQIRRAGRMAALIARSRGAAQPTGEDLERGAREASRTQLGQLATLIAGHHGWDGLVLPDAEREQLRSIASYLRHQDRVLVDWGYADAVAGPGLTALFAGESGTGKTLAAQVIATDLGVDAFRIDLATVVSKYIGETERNLDRIFAAAEGSNAILFFDEADALFGKRSAVQDAHDRYANIEVSYLLQRIESYPGSVLLATNYRRNIDEAFLRRLDVVVEFPFPEAADRAQIWRRLLPAAAPVAAAVDLDKLAARFELSGGSIRNCSVAAAFMAADEGGEIEERHLVRAIAAEYRKNGRLTLGPEFAT